MIDVSPDAAFFLRHLGATRALTGDEPQVILQEWNFASSLEAGRLRDGMGISACTTIMKQNSYNCFRRQILLHEEMLNALRRNGHMVGTQSAIFHDGKLLLSVDGRLMTLPDIYKLSEEDKKKS